MEPRIATLLGNSSSGRTSNELRTLLPPPSAPRGLHHIQPNTVSDDVQRKTTQNKRKEPSVPIAGVLNDEAPTPNIGHAIPATTTATLPPFSGRLSDLLLDPLQPLTAHVHPLQQHPNKRRRVEEQSLAPPLTGSDNKLKLPELPQQPSKKPSKRPRIPPLLQGLHHPPPLPEKVFPPITGEAQSFSRNIGDQVSGRNTLRLSGTQEKGVGDEPNKDVPVLQKEGVKDASKAFVASTSDKENISHIENESAAVRTEKPKETRKRNKWSEQETKDLLVGVSRFGIGNWKKILQCSDFAFNQRTAVDLKDRFRVCCPGDGLKRRKSTRKSDQEQSSFDDQTTKTPTTSTSCSQEQPSQGSATVGKARKIRGESDRKGPDELAEMGIHAPFTKNKRRERREFTEKDDENLLKGFEKYGSSWHSMRDDEELGFSNRHPTDLRDRFRIRYPEKFAEAGYKLKAKDEIMLKGKHKDNKLEDGKGVEKEPLSWENVSNPEGIHAVQDPLKARANTLTTRKPSSQPSATTSTESTFRSHALRQPLVNSFPSPLHDFTDLASEEDADDGRSPIILSRNILRWVDANTSQASTSTSFTTSTTSTAPTATSFSTDSSFHVVNGVETLNDEHLAPYNIPMFLTNTVLSTTPSYPPPSSVSVSASGSHRPYGPMATTSASQTKALVTATSMKASINPLLRTPNLPNLMYPPVPVSSARSAVHNLPPPADLLSGVETEARTVSDTQISATMGFTFDENAFLGFSSSNGAGFDSSATLAPMVGNAGAGQGVVYLDRELLDESFGDRRA
ncbi:hypothetical protein CC80DRAFT_498127 [Byssothecium circinans]|uniref:Myb-like domain-containing protein n=1 Tax=Byssothecium circinans TaxID=147558 RepID=A0A6A5T8J7_9PLEO|nr:hypothetical protein CC80DRAFT_498127 [Byssothecium circinans]